MFKCCGMDSSRWKLLKHWNELFPELRQAASIWKGVYVHLEMPREVKKHNGFDYMILIDIT